MRVWHIRTGEMHLGVPVVQYAVQRPIPYDAFNDGVCAADRTPRYERRRSRTTPPGSLCCFPRARDGAAAGHSVAAALGGGVSDSQASLCAARDLVGAEGNVVCFDDGAMCKVKGRRYGALHHLAHSLRHKKNAWVLMVAAVRDLIPSRSPSLPLGRAARARPVPIAGSYPSCRTGDEAVSSPWSA